MPRAHEGDPLPVHIVYPQGRMMSARVRALIDWLAPRLRSRVGAIATASGA